MGERDEEWRSSVSKHSFPGSRSDTRGKPTQSGDVTEHAWLALQEAEALVHGQTVQPAYSRHQAEDIYTTPANLPTCNQAYITALI